MLELSTKGTRTTLAELLTGKCYVAVPVNTWRGDPFQDAVPCWHPDKIWPWTNQPHPLETLASRMGNNSAFGPRK